MSDHVSDELEKIATEYNSLYNAAKSSFDGQFELFDEAKASTESTVAAAQKALDSQLAYWQDYGNNIDVIKSVTKETLGFAEDQQEQYDKFMAHVQNGTEEAAGLAASMAEAINNGNTEAVTTLAQTYAAVEEQRSAVASTVAEWQADFENRMNQIVTDAEEAINKMELDDEAETAAINTMDAYINQLKSKGADAITLAGNIASQITTALNAAAPAYSTAPSATTGFQRHKNVTGNDIGGNAAGTDYASPGLSWVGEEGPELIQLKGGERIYPADESLEIAKKLGADIPGYADGAYEVTAFHPLLEPVLMNAMSAGAAYNITIAPTFTVEGGSGSGEQLERFKDELISEVIDTLDELGIDAKRGAYA